MKFLYASPVGKAGKEFLKQIIKSFGNENFDFLIFVYDDTQFNEPEFEQCQFIYEKGDKFNFGQKYLHPEKLKDYDYLFFWDDDIDINDFDVKNFIDILIRYDLDIAQPALLKGSYYSHEITKQVINIEGRFTDFVESMVPVFKSNIWLNMWQRIPESTKSIGCWGYDELCMALSKAKRVAIIDSEAIIHTRAVQSYKNPNNHIDRYLLILRNYKLNPSKFTILSTLSDDEKVMNQVDSYSTNFTIPASVTDVIKKILLNSMFILKYVVGSLLRYLGLIKYKVKKYE